MVTPLLGSSKPRVGKIWLKKQQKNLNYLNILNVPSGKLLLYKKDVEFVLEVTLVVFLLNTKAYTCSFKWQIDLGLGR